MSNLAILGACFFMFSSLFLGFWCTVSIYITLLKIRNTLSPKTFYLYKKLINILAFELILYCTFGGTPLAIMAACYIFDIPYAMSISSIAFFFGGCFPAISALTLIFYIKPYRL